MKRALAVLLLAVSLISCTKDNKIFNLKTIRLNECRQINKQTERLYLKIFDAHAVFLTQTESYPNDLPLPVTLKVKPNIPMALYKGSYFIQLWGDTTGYISSCRINMDEYKIIFPIDMEVKSDSLIISLQGSWK